MARIWVAVLALTLILAGCVSSQQKQLALSLQITAGETTNALLTEEEALPRDIKARDIVALHKHLIKADDLQRAWRKESGDATGKVKEAADIYGLALASWVRMFEMAEKTGRGMDPLDSREMVRQQLEAHDAQERAIDMLNKIS